MMNGNKSVPVPMEKVCLRRKGKEISLIFTIASEYDAMQTYDLWSNSPQPVWIQFSYINEAYEEEADAD